MAKTEIATLGGGCFWHVELDFSKTPGVIKTRVGYMGGDENKYKNPSYKEVCTDKTGYAEVVEVTFNPSKISYEKLIEVFWKIHDTTQVNRQGPDFGTQYRSVIFYYSDMQKKIAEKSKDKEEQRRGKKIATKIAKAETFYLAEDYHQKYLEKRGLESCPV